MMTESRRRLELIIPMTEFSPGTWAATPFIRDWMLDRLVRCAANSARVAYAWLHAQFYVSTRAAQKERSLSSKKCPLCAHLRVSSAIRWLLSIRPRSASSESVTDAPVALLKALHTSLQVSRETSPDAAGFVRKGGSERT